MSNEELDALTELGQQLITKILAGCVLGDIKALVESGAPLWYQNELEGMSALHAAAHAENVDIVKYLIAQGAVWNAVDNLQNTAGDVALSLNNHEIYMMVRDAGIRTEVLLSLLESRETSEDSHDSTMILRNEDSSAAASTDAFLSSSLRFTKDAQGQDICFLNTGEQEVGVMMGWETGIMEETVNKLCGHHPNLYRGLKILNIGFGLGIIDNLFQRLPTPPSQHVIVEPHPDVLRYMREQGWGDKEGVIILEGKWQEFVERDELLAFGGFDVVYTDTFSEKYQDLHHFFSELPDLLAGPESNFSFFNGLGATNALFYDVYTNIATIHLADLGIEVQLSDLKVGEESNDRWGNTKEYFTLPLYRLPVGRMEVNVS